MQSFEGIAVHSIARRVFGKESCVAREVVYYLQLKFRRCYKPVLMLRVYVDELLRHMRHQVKRDGGVVYECA